MQRAGQFNFSKGEIAEELIARVDVASYAAALKQARNVLILKYGGVQKRPGTRLVAEVYDATRPVRLVPFQFSLQQSYALELGHGYMRAAALGGLVVETKLTITGITKAATPTVTTQNHGYVAGDQVYFAGVQGMTQINGRTARVVSVTDDDHFKIDIDTRGFSTFTGDSGGIVRTDPPPPPPPPPAPPPPAVTPTPPPTSGGSYYEDDEPRVGFINDGGEGLTNIP